MLPLPPAWAVWLATVASTCVSISPASPGSLSCVSWVSLFSLSLSSPLLSVVADVALEHQDSGMFVGRKTHHPTHQAVRAGCGVMKKAIPMSCDPHQGPRPIPSQRLGALCHWPPEWTPSRTGSVCHQFQQALKLNILTNISTNKPREGGLTGRKADDLSYKTFRISTPSPSHRHTDAHTHPRFSAGARLTNVAKGERRQARGCNAASGPPPRACEARPADAHSAAGSRCPRRQRLELEMQHIQHGLPHLHLTVLLSQGRLPMFHV